MYPKGFKSLGEHIGIKDSNLDFAAVYSEQPCSVSALFTRNRFCGPSITVGREHVADGRLQALIVHSGIANVATGEQGLRDARAIAAMAAEELAIAPTDVMVSATGVIGPHLPMDTVQKGMHGLRSRLASDSLEQTAKAIMTTDTRHKIRSVQIGDACFAGWPKGLA